ncbi:2995_t:CDS:1, partial [Cetraspora pellucida]
MYLDNHLIEHSLCNRSIGIITDIIDENTIKATFPTPQTIVTATIKKTTKYFDLN